MRFYIVSALCVVSFFVAGLNYKDRHAIDESLNESYRALYESENAMHRSKRRALREESRKLDQWTLVDSTRRPHNHSEFNSAGSSPEMVSIALFQSLNGSNKEMCELTKEVLLGSKMQKRRLHCFKGAFEKSVY